jgi:hypothetical protein
MNKKLMSLVISGLLAGSLMVGCSSSNTNNKAESSIKEEKHMTEEERMATLKGLEGDELTEAYRKLLSKDEIKYLEKNGCKIEEEAEYYQDGLSLKTPKNYGGNEVEAEKYITKEMEKAEKVYSDELFDTFSFSWTNNTGNDIDMLEISYKGYDLNGQSLNLMPVYEENISNGETRKIKINTLEKNVDRIEIVSVDIRHVAQDGLHYGGCIPGMWYKLETQDK